MTRDTTDSISERNIDQQESRLSSEFAANPDGNNAYRDAVASRPDTSSAHLPPADSVIGGLENQSGLSKQRLASSEPAGSNFSADGRRVDYPGGAGYTASGDSIKTNSGGREILSTKQPDGSIKTEEKTGTGSEIKKLENDYMKTESVYQNGEISETAVTDKKTGKTERHPFLQDRNWKEPGVPIEPGRTRSKDGHILI
ncbi:MAG: hypothetical protein K2X77_17810 [Candidatus Obscuribacterales bacterium]|nr:hypothetical protein [Candidatus Obscuribacterales bacterium]